MFSEKFHLLAYINLMNMKYYKPRAVDSSINETSSLGADVGVNTYLHLVTYWRFVTLVTLIVVSVSFGNSKTR
jgi:hypothetical protein